MIKKKAAIVAEIESKFVQAIRRGRANSRLELARLFRLAPSTAGIYVERLVSEGYLCESSGSEVQGPGRPVSRLDLLPNIGSFLGVEFAAEKIHAVCLDFSGQILLRETRDLPRPTTVARVLNELREITVSMKSRCTIPLLGIGLGVPGTVDPGKGIALDYRFIPDWQNVAPAEFLSKDFNVPILTENNARTTALGTLIFDPQERTGDFVSLLVRAGVGSGIVIDGELRRGHEFMAGEVGRIPSAWWENSPTDVAPAIEDVASTRAIIKYIESRLREGAASQLQAKVDSLTIDAVIAAVKEGDDLAREAVQRAASSLGWLAHIVALVVNPKTIILAGPLNELGDWYRLEVKNALHEHAVRSRTKQPAIQLSKLGQDAGALGAAGLAMEAWKPQYTNF